VLLLQGIAFVFILASEALRDTDWPAFWRKVFGIELPPLRQEQMA